MATTYLYRTPSSAGNRKTWTWSAWIKRARKADSNNSRLFGAGTGQSDYTSWFMYAPETTDGRLQFQNRISGTTTSVKLNRKFFDVAGWYHIVIACDTTQSSANDRMKFYVNGVQETSFAEFVPPGQNVDTMVNNNVAHNIGAGEATGYTPRYFSGAMNNVSIVDGAALTASSFGQTDTASGIWKFKPPSGVTWGTNGTHLKFENSGNLGLDSSGQTNNWTLSGNGKQILSTPTNVYATLNSLYTDGGSGITYSNGDNTANVTGNSWCTAMATIATNKGKWYWEAKITYNNHNEGYIGAATTNKMALKTNATHYLGQTTDSVGYYTGNGTIYDGSGTTAYGSAVTTGQILGCALDLDNNKIYFSINGTWQNSANPSGGTGGFNLPAGMTSTSQGNNLIVPCVSPNESKWDCNFGNGFFGTTAITSAGSNGNGSLFEYDVPSGYYALNTKNLNTYG